MHLTVFVIANVGAIIILVLLCATLPCYRVAQKRVALGRVREIRQRAGALSTRAQPVSRESARSRRERRSRPSPSQTPGGLASPPGAPRTGRK